MKYYIYTLGCKVNTYESNIMQDNLDNNGFIRGNIDSSDIYIINTCTVTNTADKKSIKLINHVIRNNKDAIIVVVGCLPQNDYSKLKDLDVDIIIGNQNKSKISEFIKKYLKDRKKIIDVNKLDQVLFENMKLNNFDQTRAFVKIQDGCDNYCSYCIIPYTRGNVRSKNKIDTLNEIKHLVNQGHKEIVLTGIHTGNYGAEFENYDFADLLNDIVKIKGLQRLRISSIEITEINDRVIDVIKNNDILVDHMHIPLQSGSDKILELMNRKYDSKYFINKINELRSIRPLISITTDVIVGFPNEEEKQFLETIETIKKVNFTKLHVFPYSKRDGTKAATMDNQIDEKIKKERVKSLLDLSKKLEQEYMDKFINQGIEFIPEVYKDGYLIGHTSNFLLIKAKGCKELLNKVVNVKIEENQHPYCLGKIIDFK